MKGTYTTPVSTEMLWKTFLAWFLRKNIIHTEVNIEALPTITSKETKE